MLCLISLFGVHDCLWRAWLYISKLYARFTYHIKRKSSYNYGILAEKFYLCKIQIFNVSEITNYRAYSDY